MKLNILLQNFKKNALYTRPRTLQDLIDSEKTPSATLLLHANIFKTFQMILKDYHYNQIFITNLEIHCVHKYLQKSYRAELIGHAQKYTER